LGNEAKNWQFVQAIGAGKVRPVPDASALTLAKIGDQVVAAR
jgi:hypothetical protein